MDHLRNVGLKENVDCQTMHRFGNREKLMNTSQNTEIEARQKEVTAFHGDGEEAGSL